MIADRSKEKRAFSIAAFCERYGIGRTSAYEEIAAGRLQAVKAGKRTLIPFDASESWLRNLPAIEPKKSGGSDVAHR
jgi:excisionase family DNA binding protein